MIAETMTVDGIEVALEELEASFLSCEESPAVSDALVLLPPLDLPALGAHDDAFLMRSARSTSRYGCCTS